MVYLYRSYHINARRNNRMIRSSLVHFRLSLLFTTVSDVGECDLYNAVIGWTRTYYDPSFCPFATRNKHLLRHHVKWEERWRGAIDVDCRGTFLPRVLSCRVLFFVHSVAACASLFPQSTALRKGMAVHSLTGGKPPSRWTGIRARWQEDVVRAIALCPNEGPLIFTSDGSKWLKWREVVEGSADGWNIKGTSPSNRPVGLGNDSLLSIRSPICAIFIPTRHCEGGCILGIHSGCSRRTFLARHAICSGGDFRRDKVKIGSAHLMEQMVKCF